LKYILRK